MKNIRRFVSSYYCPTGNSKIAGFRVTQLQKCGSSQSLKPFMSK